MTKIVKVTVYGQEYTLVYNSSTGKYEAEVTAPSDSSYQYNDGHYFPVSISATDEAGNVTTISDTVGDFQNNLRLFAKEQIKPTIVDISPSSEATITTSTPVIKFTVLDNSNGQQTGFSGINPESISLSINGISIDNSVINKEAVIGGYECTYVPERLIGDGNCTISISAIDFDGNESEITTVSFTIDTTPPSLNLNAPADGIYTNTPEINISGNAADVSSEYVTVTIEVNGIPQGDVEVSDEGYFSKVVSLTKEGENVISVTATDKAGKTSTVTRTVILKTNGPKFKTVEIAPNPVNCGKTYTISVSFEE